MLHDLDSGSIYELKVYGRMANAFSIHVGQQFKVKDSLIKVCDIYRDKNYLALYGVKRYVVEVEKSDGNRVIWKYFEGVDVEVTNNID